MEEIEKLKMLTEVALQIIIALANVLMAIATVIAAKESINRKD